MTIHFLTRPRSAVVPSLFPTGMDRLEDECAGAIEIARYCVKQTGHHCRLAGMQISRATRLSAKIAEVAK